MLPADPVHVHVNVSRARVRFLECSCGNGWNDKYISPPKTIFGREEYMFERFSKRSNAMRESLSMTIVCPKTVMELIGP
jgi:hypothetical protein